MSNSIDISDEIRAYQSDDGSYIIPVSWTYTGTFRVKAANLGEAIDAVNKHLDDLPLPSKPIYLDDSFKIDIDDDNSAMAAQEYLRNSIYHENIDLTKYETTGDETNAEKD